MNAGVIVSLTIPMALGLALGMVLALSGKSVVSITPATSATPSAPAGTPAPAAIQPVGGGSSPSPWLAPADGPGTPWWQQIP